MLLEGLQTQVSDMNAKHVGDTWMAFAKLRKHLKGETSLLVHSKIMNMNTDGDVTVAKRVMSSTQLHGATEANSGR